MLTETPKLAMNDEPPPSSTSLMTAARLDDKAGKALRIALARALKDRYGDSIPKLAKALDMSNGGVKNILDGTSNGSLMTATKICGVLKIPLDTIVGEALAKTARSRMEKAKTLTPKFAPVPPPPSSPVIPRHESVTGMKVGVPVPRQAVTWNDIASLRRGEFNVEVLGRVLDEYEDMKAALEKLKNRAFREYLASIDG